MESHGWRTKLYPDTSTLPSLNCVDGNIASCRVEQQIVVELCQRICQARSRRKEWGRWRRQEPDGGISVISSWETSNVNPSQIIQWWNSRSTYRWLHTESHRLGQLNFLYFHTENSSENLVGSCSVQNAKLLKISIKIIQVVMGPNIFSLSLLSGGVDSCSCMTWNKQLCTT